MFTVIADGTRKNAKNTQLQNSPRLCGDCTSGHGYSKSPGCYFPLSVSSGRSYSACAHKTEFSTGGQDGKKCTMNKAVPRKVVDTTFPIVHSMDRDNDKKNRQSAQEKKMNRKKKTVKRGTICFLRQVHAENKN